MSGGTALDRTFKLSFIAYLKAVVAAAVEVAVLVFLRDRIDGVGKYFGLVLFGIFLFLAWRLLSLWMVRWRVTDRGLEVKGGVLPWRRFHRSIPYAAIFEAYYNRGFVGYVCRYGTVTVRRSEGATSALIQKGCTTPGHCRDSSTTESPRTARR